MNNTSNKITADHLARRAYVYIRQSTPDQVKNNLESKRLQYGLVDRARSLGWQDIDVIDDDLGISGSGIRRPGFERLLSAVCDGQVGAVFSIEASRLARTNREWHTLLEFCGIVGVLLIDAQAIYDPRLTNDRLLLGVKGTISEMEVATFRERAQSALMQMAQRGDLVRRVAIGYVRGANDRIEKDPDGRVRAAIDLIFRKFAELGSVRQVYFWLNQQQIQLPIVRGPEDAQEIIWQPARYHAVHSVLKNPIYAGAYAYGRSQTVPRLEAGHKRVSRQLRRRREEWSVLILNHHEGYIDWDVYENNQKVIMDNYSVVRGAIKKGQALGRSAQFAGVQETTAAHRTEGHHCHVRRRNHTARAALAGRRSYSGRVPKGSCRRTSLCSGQGSGGDHSRAGADGTRRANRLHPESQPTPHGTWRSMDGEACLRRAQPSRDSGLP